MKKLISIFLIVSASASAWSVEHKFKGIIDIRAYHVDNEGDAKSYLAGDYGKFRYDAGSGVALGQLGLQYHLNINDYWSANIVGNAFANKGNNNFGFTEGYISYKGLPSANGWRLSSKIGVFYPNISLENISTAWSTPYTLTSSSLNNWIGEELRNTGASLRVDKLGKSTKSPHSFTVEVALFQNNDPAGAMLAWHGWTIGSRQTLLQEKLIVQNFPAREGMLAAQAPKSDPFLELDNKWGGHLSATWQYQNSFKLNAGYYDNRAEKGLVENGQYTWTTAFSHLGLKYKIAPQLELIGQYMVGNTNMFSPDGLRVVDNDFDNAFLMLRKAWKNSHIAVRVEHFNVDDLDETIGDNNNESGHGVSIAYRYKLTRQSFFMAEYNWLDSDRPSRYYEHQPIELSERQYQVAYRYYF